MDVKELRSRLGMTQQQFAHEVGVSIRIVGYWESGKKKPSNLALARMRDVEKKHFT